jgi:hypothetical protein
MEILMKIEKKQKEERSKKAHIEHHEPANPKQEELEKHAGKLNHGERFGQKWFPETGKK